MLCNIINPSKLDKSRKPSLSFLFYVIISKIEYIWPAREILVYCSAKFLAPVYESLPRSYQRNRKINVCYKIKKLALRREPECSPSVFFLLNERESYSRLSCRSDSSSQGATRPCLKSRQAKLAPNNISQCRFAISRYSCENLARASSSSSS